MSSAPPAVRGRRSVGKGPAGSGSRAPAHLTYMTDFDSSYFPARAQPLQHTWLNFLLPVVADACTEKHGPVCPDALAGITHGWERYGKRSLYTELPDLHGSALPPPPNPHPTPPSLTGRCSATRRPGRLRQGPPGARSELGVHDDHKGGGGQASGR